MTGVPWTPAGSAIARGGQAAQEMTQQNPPGAFDVFTHSYDGISESVQAAAKDPIGFAREYNQRRLKAASEVFDLGNTKRSSFTQVRNSITAQANALDESVEKVRKAKGTLATVGATFELLTGVEQMISTAFSVIPWPAFPALRVGDIAVGVPHAHSHPPNTPPTPPVTLPSVGPVIPIPFLSGARRTLINGRPAALCGDMGVGAWCGGYFPFYEVFLGSSNVWIEGRRAARILCDVTRHCLLTSAKPKGGTPTPKVPAPMAKPPASTPKDVPIGILWGTTLTASWDVFIGGVPMPWLLAGVLGVALRPFFKLAGKGAKAFGRLTAPLRRRFADALKLESGFLRCNVLRAEPVNILTGEVVLRQQDYAIPGRIPIVWTRLYGSQSSHRGVCGYGWSTPADARLVLERDGAATFHDGCGGANIFPYLPSEGIVDDLVEGLVLEAANGTLRIRVKDGLAYVFKLSDPYAVGTEILIQEIQDRCGNSLRYIRDHNGLSGIVESAGRCIEIESDHGLIQKMWFRNSQGDPPHLFVSYEYSEAAELLAVCDALGYPYRFKYERRRLVQHTNRNSLSFYYAYDSEWQSARCYHAWGDGGLYDYRFEFDPSMRRLKITNSVGSVSVLQLNEQYLPIWETDALGGITKYEYDDRGRTVAVIDQEGHRTAYEYDKRGNLLRLRHPNGVHASITYDSQNKPVTITYPNNASWQYKWDGRGLLVEQSAPLGHVSRYEYDAHGQLIALTNPRGARTDLEFDRVGNLSRLIDPLGRTTSFAHDDRSNLIGKLDAVGRRTLYQYDATGRVTQVQLPSGACAYCEYDPQGNLIQYTDERGAITRLQCSGLGEVLKRIQPDGQIVQYFYDTEGRLTSVVNQRQETYQVHRDALGRVIEEIDFWGQSRKYEYSAAGHIRRSIDPLGREIRYSTDALGRVLGRTYPCSHTPGKAFNESFEYDANGNLVAAENPHGRVERRFDSEGQLLEERQGEYFSVLYAYDEVGNRVWRRTEVKHGAGATSHEVRFTYDALDQAIEISIDHRLPIQISRNAVGEIAIERLSASLERDVEYSQDGYVTRRRLFRGKEFIFDTEYGYDRAGNIVLRHDRKLGSDRYDYDPMGRIIQHIDPAGALKQYLSDPAGDLLRTRVHEQPVVPGKTTGSWSREGIYEGAFYGFDRAGNLIVRRDEDKEVTLTWDAARHLTESRARELCTRYGYDCLGRRLFKHTGDHKTLFYWDGEVLLGEITLRVNQPAQPESVPEHLREYLYYPDTFEPLAYVDTRPGGASEVHFYQNEPNGCPTLVTDESGEVKWAASYDSWGGISKVHCRLTNNPLRLQGQYYDTETGLHYNRYRYYDPHIGLFVSEDPLGLGAGDNLFQFGNNTLVWIDPLGLIFTFSYNAAQLDVVARGVHINVSWNAGRRGRGRMHVELKPDVVDNKFRLRVVPADPTGRAMPADLWDDMVDELGKYLSPQDFERLARVAAGAASEVGDNIARRGELVRLAEGLNMIASRIRKAERRRAKKAEEARKARRAAREQRAQGNC